MVAISLALSFLGLLAFVAFRDWLRARTAVDRFDERLRDVEGRMPGLTNLGIAVLELQQAARDHDASEKAHASLREKVRNVEMKVRMPGVA